MPKTECLIYILHLLVFEEHRCELQLIDKSAEAPHEEEDSKDRLKNATCIGHSIKQFQESSIISCPDGGLFN